MSQSFFREQSTQSSLHPSLLVRRKNVYIYGGLGQSTVNGITMEIMIVVPASQKLRWGVQAPYELL
ncbi:hypothetical protein A0H81_08643 [Grifola frondosa]|uniref:Uncharacterized protein n=1 Tax=Grifola frondosa TaxID=5627 RepID=A0A1C7M3S6_GRIFR|nr:hypothetical protein A0H81_08643 [Grifola frondosa]